MKIITAHIKNITVNPKFYIMTPKNQKTKNETSVSTNELNKLTAQLHQAIIEKRGTADHNRVNLFDHSEIEVMKICINDALNIFLAMSENDMTLIERRRKIGAGVKNYGFMDKTSDYAEEFPQFALFEVSDLKNSIRNVEDCRMLLALLKALERIISNSMLVYSTEAYSLSLTYYNTVKDLGKRGNPQALEIFRQLQPFFRSRGSRKTKEPTERQLKRDINALLHDHKDGKIVVENEKSHTEGGKHIVIDETHRPAGEWKATEHGEIE